jgi:Fe-S oxidoreductase
MAKMKVEFLYHYNQRHGLRLFDRAVAYLPRYAPMASRLGPLLNLRNRVPGLAGLGQLVLGISRHRKLPQWRRDVFTPGEVPSRSPSPGGPPGGPDVVLWADTFNTYFEPENARAAKKVLEAAGYRVRLPVATDGGRPLCCGRTFLAAGLVDEAKEEARRMLKALGPFVEEGVPVIGLEPSCLLTLRDEFSAMLPGNETDALSGAGLLFEEFLTREQDAGTLELDLRAIPQKRALLHGHCHQKAFDVMGAVEKALGLVPELDVETIQSSCCGMAGGFGYEAENFEISMKMAEMDLLPAVRQADDDTLIVAGGTSCRHQIKDGTQRKAVHVARVLESALAEAL